MKRPLFKFGTLGPLFACLSSDWDKSTVHLFACGLEADETSKGCTMYDLYVVAFGFRVTAGFFVVERQTIVFRGCDDVVAYKHPWPMFIVDEVKKPLVDWRSVMFRQGGMKS